MRRMIEEVNKTPKYINIESADFSKNKGHINQEINNGYYIVKIKENLAEEQHLTLTFPTAVMIKDIDDGLLNLSASANGIVLSSAIYVKENEIPTLNFTLPANHKVNYNIFYIVVNNGVASIKTSDTHTSTNLAIPSEKNLVYQGNLSDVGTTTATNIEKGTYFIDFIENIDNGGYIAHHSKIINVDKSEGNILSFVSSSNDSIEDLSFDYDIMAKTLTIECAGLSGLYPEDYQADTIKLYKIG